MNLFASVQEQVDNIRGGNPDAPTTIKNLLYGAYFLIGIVAVIMIIYGGYSYMTSQGDSSKVSKGKTTILYGIIGLIVAILAGVITGFIMNNV